MIFHWHRWGEWQDGNVKRTYAFLEGEFRTPAQMRRCEKCGKTQLRELVTP